MRFQSVTSGVMEGDRIEVIAGLDEMTRSLASARKQATVADRGEADALTARVGGLRSDLLGEFDVPRSEANAY